MAWRCWVFGHVIGGLVGRGDVLHVQCARCLRLSPGVGIGPLPDAPVVWWRRILREVRYRADLRA